MRDSSEEKLIKELIEVVKLGEPVYAWKKTSDELTKVLLTLRTVKERNYKNVVRSFSYVSSVY